jgi:hypothetical protein
MLVFIALSHKKLGINFFLLVQVIFYIFDGTCEIKGFFYMLWNNEKDEKKKELIMEWIKFKTIALCNFEKSLCEHHNCFFFFGE